MDENYTDDTFLARWLSGDLSPEEQKNFEQSKAYDDYKKIIEGADQLEVPSLDRQRLFDAIQQETASKTISLNDKPVRKISRWLYPIAATILLILGFSYFFSNSDTTYTTSFGEQLAVQLPDGSEVTLNAKSTLSFNEKTWNENRTLALEGEAYFDVAKGATFTVNTSEGTVEVLGTEFNVTTAKDYFQVKCFEGTVKVESTAKKSAILTVGKAFSVINNQEESWNFNPEELTWKQGESTFKNVPLQQVITALERQFNITFIKNNIDETQRFTGSFSHKDVKLALKTVFDPMEIEYTFKNETTIELKKKA